MEYRSEQCLPRDRARGAQHRQRLTLRGEPLQATAQCQLIERRGVVRVLEFAEDCLDLPLSVLYSRSTIHRNPTLP